MALSKSCPTPFGVAASYLRILAIRTVYDNGKVEVQLEFYASVDARKNKSRPMQTITVEFECKALGSIEPTRPQVYAFLATQDAFLGATEI